VAFHSITVRVWTGAGHFPVTPFGKSQELKDAALKSRDAKFPSSGGATRAIRKWPFCINLPYNALGPELPRDG
jgi:hypothetical protein